MSLADRLAEARRQKAPSAPAETDDTLTGRPSTKRKSADPFGDLKRQVHQALLDSLGPKLYDSRQTQSELEQKVRQTLQEVLSQEDTPLTTADRARIAQEIADDILGYGPLEPYLRDPDITEVMVNGANDIWIERAGRIYKTEGEFADESHLRLTIRKFAADPYRIEDLIGFGTVTRTVADFLDACVRGKLNILVSGGTGAGKTTTLNVLSSFIPEDERIVTIEDAAELQLHQDHVLRLEARPPNIEGRGEVKVRDLVRNALRMRPDRIVVGEVRDAAALDMLQAMNTGHDGSICTVHANTPRDVLARVETMVLMAGVDLPVRAIREQVSSAIDVVVQQTRFKDGTRHITHVTEVVGMEGDVITLQDIFLFDHGAGFDENGRSQGTLKSTGLRPKFLDKLSASGVKVDPAIFAFEKFAGR
jgi:pilus assembly protein CpaF